MAKRLVGMLLAAALLVLAGLPLQAAQLEQIDQLILTKDLAKIQEAAALLEERLEKNPEDGETLWLLSKAYLYLGDRTADGKLEVFEKGKEYADRAVEVLPNSPHAHYWQSALIGRIGQTRGILSSLFMVRPMKDALDRVLELDENYAPAHWVLSQLYHQAPGFPLSIGSKKLALEHAQRAVALEPEDLEFQLQLAVALEYNGKKGEALELLEGLRSNPKLNSDPELAAQVEEHYISFSK